MKKESKPRCGLCGESENLTQTECCGEWICDDEDQYVIFSFARNSCHRNHRRLTLCAFHYGNGHKGDWAECEVCKEAFDTEDYVNRGTNEYNFRKLRDPPSFEPTRCSECNQIINRMTDGYTISLAEDTYRCEKCFPV